MLYTHKNKHTHLNSHNVYNTHNRRQIPRAKALFVSTQAWASNKNYSYQRKPKVGVRSKLNTRQLRVCVYTQAHMQQAAKMIYPQHDEQMRRQMVTIDIGNS